MNVYSLNAAFFNSNLIISPIIYDIMLKCNLRLNEKVIWLIDIFEVKTSFSFPDTSTQYYNSADHAQITQFANLLAASAIWCCAITLLRIFFFSKERFYDPKYLAQGLDKSFAHIRPRSFLALLLISAIISFAVPVPHALLEWHLRTRYSGMHSVYIISSETGNFVWSWLWLSSTFSWIYGWIVYIEIPKKFKSQPIGMPPTV